MARVFRMMSSIVVSLVLSFVCPPLYALIGTRQSHSVGIPELSQSSRPSPHASRVDVLRPSTRLVLPELLCEVSSLINRPLLPYHLLTRFPPGRGSLRCGLSAMPRMIIGRMIAVSMAAAMSVLVIVLPLSCCCECVLYQA